jgi:hypothetical protein
MVDSQSTQVTQVDPYALDTATRRIAEAALTLSTDSDPPAISPALIGHDGRSAALTRFYQTWTPAMRNLADAAAGIAVHLQDARRAYLAADQGVIHGGDLQ